MRRASPKTKPTKIQARKKVLLSSLGASPAIVTEAIDKVEEEERIEFDIVVTIRTGHGESRRGEQDILRKHILSHYKGRILYIPLSVRAENIYTEKDSLEYLTAVAEQLRAYRDSADVYVSLAGGRKTMSASMAIAVQIYGAALLFHIIHRDVDESPSLRQKMSADYLVTLGSRSRELRSMLHPPLEKLQLVRFPIVSLFPLLNDLRRALNGVEIESFDRKTQDLLKTNRLVTAHGNRWRVTSAGDQLLKVLRDIQNVPAISQIREKLALAPTAGARALSDYVDAESKWKSKKPGVYTARMRIEDACNNIRMFGPSQEELANRNRAVYALLKIIESIEVAEEA
jgi:CRISPR-associated protein Csx14